MPHDNPPFQFSFPPLFWQRTAKSPHHPSGIRGYRYIYHFYMTSIWGVPTAFPGTGRTELQPGKPPWKNTDKEHLFSRFKPVFRHFNRLSPTFLVRRTFPPAQPVHRIRVGGIRARFGRIFPSHFWSHSMRSWKNDAAIVGYEGS